MSKIIIAESFEERGRGYDQNDKRKTHVEILGGYCLLCKDSISGYGYSGI